MTPDQLEQLQNTLTKAVETQIKVTVNGKIDKLHQIMESHMEDDKRVALEFSEKFDTYIKDDKEWKDKAQPVIELGENLTWSSMAILKILGALGTIGGIVAVIVSFTKK